MLLIGVLGMPIAMSIWLTLMEDGPPGGVRRAVGLTAGSVALCALGLLPFAGQTPPLSMTWLPTAGTLRLSLGTTSLYSIAATALAAAALFVLPTIGSGVRGRTGGLLLLALAAGNLAFLADHFLLRYVALEVAGLCIAAAPLLAGSGRARFGQATHVYVLLRLGDAGLLVAILLLGRAGTLEIAPALANFAALEGAAAWVVGGFFLAVAVKLGLWPFHTWMAPGALPSRSAHAWLYATLMPNLGLYLLYRVAPLPAASPLLRTALLGAGLVSGLITAWALWRRPEPSLRAARLTALLHSLVWCLALLLEAKVAWWGLLALSAVRLPLYLRSPRPEAADGRVPAAEPALDGNLRRLARWIYGGVETGGLERLVVGVSAGLVGVARWLYTHVERGMLDQGLESLTQRTVAVTEETYVVLEQRGLEGLFHTVARTLLAGSARLRRWHTGRLRVNLWWLILSLALALLWVLY
jgi:hypothetical protein